MQKTDQLRRECAKMLLAYVNTMYFKTNEFAIVMFFRFLMINTTDHGRSIPSLLSATEVPIGNRRSDYVSILSDLAGGKDEVRASSPGARARWAWGLAAAILAGGAALVGTKLVSITNRTTDVSPALMLIDSAAKPVMPTQSAGNAVPEGEVAAAVIRDSRVAAAPAERAEPGMRRETASAAASDVAANATLGTPRAATAKAATPIATAAAKPRAPKLRSTKAQPAPRAVDSDVDIITAIVKHAEKAPAY